MQDKQLRDAQLSPYLPAQKNKNKSSNKLDKAEEKLQNIKRIMKNMEKNQSLNQNKIKKKLQKVVESQKSLYNIYDVRLEQFRQCTLRSQPQRISDFKPKQRTIQDIYRQQMRISSEIQQYIERISQKLTQGSIKLTKISKKQQLQHKQVDLPSAELLHNQLLQQVSGCQQKFNIMMQQTDKKLIILMQNLKMSQKILIQEMQNMVKSRIASMELNLK